MSEREVKEKLHGAGYLSDVANNKEPAWIRDVEAGAMELRVPPAEMEEVLPRLFAGFVTYCDFCGAAFPLWPPKELCLHALDQHGTEMTLQQMRALSDLTAPVYGPMHVLYVTPHVMTRVAIRRRALELGLWHPALPENRRIVGLQ